MPPPGPVSSSGRRGIPPIARAARIRSLSSRKCLVPFPANQSKKSFSPRTMPSGWAVGWMDQEELGAGVRKGSALNLVEPCCPTEEWCKQNPSGR